MKKAYRVGFYIFTAIIHWVIATLFLKWLGGVGFIIMVSHWFILKGCCIISYGERWLHYKVLGISYLKFLNFKSTPFYRFLTFIHKKVTYVRS